MTEKMDGGIDPYDQGIAARYTPLLRKDDEPRWRRLRSRLEAEDVHPSDAAIGSLFPDDVKLEFGVVVTRDGRAFKFTFDFLRDASGAPISSRSEAVVASWEPLTPDELSSTYSRGVQAGLALLEQENRTAD